MRRFNKVYKPQCFITVSNNKYKLSPKFTCVGVIIFSDKELTYTSY